MDQSNLNRNVEQWIEYWRKQRVQKMASRLQLHSNKPRTISSSILGLGNTRQQITVPPSLRHSRVDHLWNSNYHSGFRKYNSIHKQYHHADKRGNRPLYQSGQKIVYFGSQQSLYNKRIHKPIRKHSSCGNINQSGIEAENQNILHLSESRKPVDCSAIEKVPTDVRSLDCLSDANEKYLPEPQPIVDNCHAEVGEIIGALSVIDSNLELTGNMSCNPVLALEAKYKGADDTTENILKVEEISSEPISSVANGSIADIFSKLEISFSYDPEAKVVEDSTVEPIVYVDTASDQNAEAATQSESSVKPTKEDDSILNVAKTGIIKEIENKENRCAKISTIHENDLCKNSECKTPMKREKKNMLLDATNILPSSTIKYAFREVRKNDELEAVVTPVRRSLRISSVTPISSKNMCLESLKELSPELFQKIKFVPNPAIDIPPDC